MTCYNKLSWMVHPTIIGISLVIILLYLSLKPILLHMSNNNSMYTNHQWGMTVKGINHFSYLSDPCVPTVLLIVVHSYNISIAHHINKMMTAMLISTEWFNSLNYSVETIFTQSYSSYPWNSWDKDLNDTLDMT